MGVLCTHDGVKIWKKGHFLRDCVGRKRVQRFMCSRCRKTFSDQTSAVSFRQKKPHLNHSVLNFFCMGISQQEIARFLQTKPRTVARILVRLATHVRGFHETWVQTTEKISMAVFDEMEPSGRTTVPALSSPR